MTFYLAAHQYIVRMLGVRRSKEPTNDFSTANSLDPLFAGPRRLANSN